MIGEKMEEKPITLAEMKEILSERKKGRELTYEQDLALQYAKRFAKLSKAQAEKLAEELSKNAKLDSFTIAKIVDILPKNKETLELLLSKNISLEASETEEILNASKKYFK